MAKIKYTVAAKNGSYQKDGEEKTRWHIMGNCFENDKGQLSIKIDSMPINFDGWISLFTPKDKTQSGNQTQGNADALSDDIPF